MDAVSERNKVPEYYLPDIIHSRAEGCKVCHDKQGLGMDNGAMWEIPVPTFQIPAVPTQHCNLVNMGEGSKGLIGIF